MADIRDFYSPGDTDAQAIRKAHAYALNSPYLIALEPGKSYTYDSTPLTGSRLKFVCPDAVGSIDLSGSSPSILLPAGASLFDSSEAVYHIVLSGVSFRGGANPIRMTYAGPTNVGAFAVIKQCAFVGFSGCAIASESSDRSLWDITRNILDAANSTAAIGIALSGLADGSLIGKNSFANMRVGVKLRPGNNIRVVENEFIAGKLEGDSSVPCVNVWLVPAESSTNSGQGNTISWNKFGSERLSPADRRILIADEEAGAATIGAKMPVTDTESTGYMVGVEVSGNSVYGRGESCKAFVTSTTKNAGVRVGKNTYAGTLPDHVFEWLYPPTTKPAYRVSIEPQDYHQPPTGTQMRLSNATAFVSDAAGVHSLTDSASPSGSNTPPKVITRFPTRFSAGAASMADAVDPLGGTDAATITFGASGGLVVRGDGSAAASVNGAKHWLEFDYSGTGTVGFNFSVGADQVISGSLLASSETRHACIEVPIGKAYASGDISIVLYGTSGATCTISRPVFYAAPVPVRGVASEGVQYAAMTAAGSTTATGRVLRNTTATAIAAHTVVIPAAPSDGQTFSLQTVGEITALSVTGTATSKPSTLAAGGFASWQYAAAGSIWYRTA